MSKKVKKDYEAGKASDIERVIGRYGERYENVQYKEERSKILIYIGDMITYTYMKPTGRWIKRTVNKDNEQVAKPVSGSNIGTMFSCINNDLSMLELVGAIKIKKKEEPKGFLSRCISIAFPKK